MSNVLEDILDSHAEYYILATMKYMKGIGPNPALGTDGGNKQDRLSKAKLEALLSKRELEARVDEHMSWVLPTTEASHTFEQDGEGSGIQWFDNERLGRLNQLTNREEK